MRTLSVTKRGLIAFGEPVNSAQFFGLVNAATANARARYFFRSAEKLGSRVRLWGAPYVSSKGHLRIGSRVRFVSTVAKLELVVEEDATMEIGDNVLINYGCALGATQLVRIGARCNIGAYAMLIDNAFHQVDPDHRDDRPASAPVILGENVWLASRVIVLPGVTIGDNSVVGAGSVVTRDIPPDVLAAGAPARVLRPLHHARHAERQRLMSNAGS